MADSNTDNVRPLRVDPTNPRQAEMAALATLEHAERVHRQIVKLREEHVAWYRGIEANELGRVDAIMREAASHVALEVVQKALPEATINALLERPRSTRYSSRSARGR